MSEDLVRQFMFEDQPVNILTWKGKPAWIAREIGTALGYADGKHLVDLIRDEWSHEFFEGEDFIRIEGPELASLKELLRRSGYNPLDGQVVLERTSSVLLLFQPGLDGALMKTDKPKGARMRRWLRSEVLSNLRATGSYSLPNESPSILSEAIRSLGIDDATVLALLEVLEKALQAADRPGAHAILVILRRMEARFAVNPLALELIEGLAMKRLGEHPQRMPKDSSPHRERKRESYRPQNPCPIDLSAVEPVGEPPFDGKGNVRDESGADELPSTLQRHLSPSAIHHWYLLKSAARANLFVQNRNLEGRLGGSEGVRITAKKKLITHGLLQVLNNARGSNSPFYVLLPIGKALPATLA